jgi:hypothetical protein
MISIENKFLFVHVPKTGGNSIQNILRKYSEDRIVCAAPHQDGIERFGVRNDRYNIEKHSTLTHYKNVLGADVYNSLFRFAVIRNPWERMISHYFSPHRDVPAWDRDAFIALVESMPPIRYYICDCTQPGGPRHLTADIHYLMRFEDLENEFRRVCGLIGIPGYPLPIRNRSNHEHYAKYYDETLIQLVRERFQEEILLMGYHFGD